MNINDLSPVDHQSHPNFIQIVGGLRDSETGVRVVLAKYSESQDYEGGLYVETYGPDPQDSDDMIISEPCEANVDLGKALSEAVSGFLGT